MKTKLFILMFFYCVCSWTQDKGNLEFTKEGKKITLDCAAFSEWLFFLNDPQKYMVEEFFVLDNEGNRISFYGTLQNCLVEETSNGIEVKVMDYLPNFSVKGKESVWQLLFTDSYQYEKDKLVKKRTYNKKLTQLELYLVNKRYAQFKKEYAKPVSIDKEDLYFDIQTLFLLALNDKSARSDLKNFQRFLSSIMDGELKEVWQEYNNYVEKFNKNEN